MRSIGDEQNLVHVFFNGLKPEMQEVLKIKEPQGLTQHIVAVIGMEGSAFCKFVNMGKQTGTGSFRSRQRYTDANQLDAMRRNIICFKCHVPYSKTHLCAKKELRVLMVINGYGVKILDECARVRSLSGLRDKESSCGALFKCFHGNRHVYDD